MNTAEVIGIIVGLVTVVAGAGKWLLGDWAKKSEELERIKEKNTRKSIADLEAVLKAIGSDMKTLGGKIQDHSVKIVTLEAKFEAIAKRLDYATQIAEKMTAGTADLIRNEIRSQIVKLTEELSMIKMRKNGKA